MPPVLENYERCVASGDIAPDPSQLALARRLDSLAHALAGYRGRSREPRWKRLLGSANGGLAPRGVYIWGGVGRGKTMLMDLFHDRAAFERKRRVHFHRFMQEVHQSLHAIRQKQRSGHLWEDADPITLLCQSIAENTVLLCFDEFQVTDITDAMILGRLFEALLGQGVVIVATSNTHPRDLYRDGLNRDAFLPFIAMLESRLDIIRVNGPRDYRMDRIAGETLYVTPLGAAADRQIERLWGELARGAEERARSLQLAGRVLDASRTAGGIARFSFAELCERPLGAHDYIAIGEAFHTVMVTGVPRLDKANHNEARRFTILIDTLYDRRTRLIVSAETPPEGIYVGAGAGAEFARTVSRLHEMCSQSYWQAAENGSGKGPSRLATGTHPG